MENNLPQTQKENQLPKWETSLVKSWEKIKPVSFTDAVKSNSPNLKDLVAIHSQIKVAALLTIKIESLIKFFNVGKNMDSTQIADTIMLIIENYPRLKPEDLELCFKKAKMGQYGPIYDRLDGQVIIGWIFKYVQAKEAFIEHNNFMLHLEKKKQDTPSTPEMRKAGFELLKKSFVEPLQKKEAEKKRQYSIEASKRQMENLTKDQYWLNEFDRLYKKWGKHLNNGTRYILRYGKSLTVTDFLLHKQDQFSRVIDELNYRNAIRNNK